MPHKSRVSACSGSGSLRAFAEEMAELRRLLLAHPRAQGQEIPKRATDLLQSCNCGHISMCVHTCLFGFLQGAR